MYKLSQVLAALEKLNSIDSDLSVSFPPEIEEIVDTITKFDLINNGKAKRELASIKGKTKKINELIEEIYLLKAILVEKLEEEQKQSHLALLKSVNNNQYQFEWPTDEDYLAHRASWSVSPAVFDQTISMIGQYIDWRYPVAYVEPHTGELVRYLASGDPLYVVDDRELPYQNLLNSLPAESANKIHHYKKTEASCLEPNSVGMCVSWKNIPFMKIGEIEKDIKLMSTITAPGGYVIFDYVDAGTAAGAAAVEEGKFSFQWRDRIVRFLTENNLEILHEIYFADYEPTLVVCKKQGDLAEINLNNKLGLVLADQTILSEKRQKENRLREFYKSVNSSLENDVKEIEKRDAALNELEQQRKVNIGAVTQTKLKTAMVRLEQALAQYPSSHPTVLEAILNLSKLTYALGRIKDSYNLLKRSAADVEKIDKNSALYKNYYEWKNFLNNN